MPISVGFMGTNGQISRSSRKENMKASDAQKVADEVIEFIKPFCTTITVAGSLRRHKEEVGDVDIVAIPLDRDGILYALPVHTFITNGEKVKSFIYKDVHVDLYLTEPNEFEPTLMHRTGSKWHNIMIAKRATALGYHLSTSKGLLGVGGGVIADSERSIFRMLKLEYKEPWERD